LRQQIYLGDEDFIQRMQALAAPARLGSAEVPQAHRADPGSVAAWRARCGSREEALARAHREGGLTMTAIAAQEGVTVARVSQLIAAWERARGGA
jgi:hypothetical protein